MYPNQAFLYIPKIGRQYFLMYSFQQITTHNLNLVFSLMNWSNMLYIHHIAVFTCWAVDSSNLKTKFSSNIYSTNYIFGFSLLLRIFRRYSLAWKHSSKVISFSVWRSRTWKLSTIRRAYIISAFSIFSLALHLLLIFYMLSCLTILTHIRNSTKSFVRTKQCI